MSGAPTLGLFGLNQGELASPDAMSGAATLAEELGYDSVWLGEHLVVPSPWQPPSPMHPLDPIFDSLVALAYLAARTERIRLATGIVILPQRNPVVLAKQVATLDALSGGRLTLGVAAGYLEPEMSAVGVPMKGRGRRVEEHLAAMRALWEAEAPVHSGEHVAFAGVDAHPRPVQRPLPVVIGGHSPAAHRRAARHAQAGTGSSSTWSRRSRRSPACARRSWRRAARPTDSRSASRRAAGTTPRPSARSGRPASTGWC